MTRIFATMSLLLATLLAGASYAQDGSERQDVYEILEIAKGWGSADMDVDSTGDPLIIGRMDGTKYGILFYDCSSDKQRCRAMQFNAGWADSANTLTMQELHDLNKDNIFGKWYFDSVGDVSVKLAVNLAYGYSRQNLDDTFDWWRVVLKKTKEQF